MRTKIRHRLPGVADKTQGLYGDSCQMDLVFDDIPGSSDSYLGYRPRKHRYFQVSRCLFLQERNSLYIYNIPVFYLQQRSGCYSDVLSDQTQKQGEDFPESNEGRVIAVDFISQKYFYCYQ